MWLHSLFLKYILNINIVILTNVIHPNSQIPIFHIAYYSFIIKNVFRQHFRKVANLAIIREY